MIEDIALKYGIDYKQGVQNCVGNQEFYKKILGLFVQDTCMKLAEVAFKDKDYETLFAKMHELKGVSGNAALSKLFTVSSSLVSLLRNPPIDEKQVEALFYDTKDAYDQAIIGAKLISEL